MVNTDSLDQPVNQLTQILIVNTDSLDQPVNQ